MLCDAFFKLSKERKALLFRVKDANGGRRLEIEAADGSAEIQLVFSDHDLHNLAYVLTEADELGGESGSKA